LAISDITAQALEKEAKQHREQLQDQQSIFSNYDLTSLA